MIKRLKREESGYSLVEVVVAIMILAIAIIPMVGMFDAGLRAAVLGSNYDKGRALANEKLEEIKALTYEDAVAQYPPVNGDPPNPTPFTDSEGIFNYDVETAYAWLDPSTQEIEPYGDARTMMQVTVTVTWDGSKRYETTGLVSK